MKRQVLLIFLLTGCASFNHPKNNEIAGVAHSDCGAAEGGSIHLALDAKDQFLIVHADGSWGRGGDQGWTLAAESPDFSVLVCTQDASNCSPASKAHLIITSSSDSTVQGKIAYENSYGQHEFVFRARRTDAHGPIRVCP